MKHILLVFLLALLFSSAFGSSCRKPSKDHKTICTKNKSTKNIIGPVCAYFKEGCPSGTCNKTIEDGRTACQDPSVLYYEKGRCINESYSCMMISARMSPCPPTYSPICASLETCSEPDCSRATKTFDNLCLACSTPGYQYFAIGICDEDKLFCPQTPSSDCPSTEDPICAVVSEDPSLPVYLRKQTFANSCTACSQFSPLYYIPGACTFDCTEVYGEGIIIDCVGSTLSPVCGAYTDGCTNSDGVCHQTFDSSCSACSSGSFSYTEGQCQGRPGISCALGIPFTCLDLDPVCGLFSEDCTDSSCRKTYENSCEACQDTQVVSYAPGPCAGDGGVPCDPANRPDSAGCPQDSSIGPICGITRADCDDSSCRQTFGTTCLACADSSILFYNRGAC